MVRTLAVNKRLLARTARPEELEALREVDRAARKVYEDDGLAVYEVDERLLARMDVVGRLGRLSMRRALAWGPSMEEVLDDIAEDLRQAAVAAVREGADALSAARMCPLPMVRGLAEDLVRHIQSWRPRQRAG